MVNKISVTARLYLLAFVMCFLIIVMGTYGMVEIKTMHQHTQTIYRDRLVPLQQLTTIRFSYSVHIGSAAAQIQSPQSSFIAVKKEIAEAEKNIAASWKVYMLTWLTPEEKQLAQQASALMNKATKSIQELKLLLNREDTHALDNFIYQELYPAITPVIAKMTELIDLQTRVGEQVYTSNTEVYNTAVKKSVLLIVLSLVFAIPFSYYLVKNVQYLIKHLLESESKYRNIFENIQDVFYQTSLTGNILDISPSIKYHTGFSRGEMIGTPATNIYFDPEDREKGVQLLKEKGQVTDYEFRLKSIKGEPFYVSLNARLIRAADGSPSHIDGLFRNITDRKKAAEKIIQSEARLKEAQAIAHIGNWETDMVNGIHQWSDEFYKIFGTNKNTTQPSNEALLSFVYPDDLEKVKDDLMETSATVKDSTVDFRFIRKDGSLRHAHAEWQVEFDEYHHPLRLYGILQDITERTLAEESIKQSESNYRQLFECSPAPMWLFDESSCKFMQVNHSCMQHYGYSEEEFARMTIMDIVPAHAETATTNTGAKKMLVNRFFIGAQRHITKSGEIIDAETSSIPVVLNGKKLILVVATDVTERNRYEQKLARAAIKAQEDERYEIGGELHENVCQILATSLLFLEMIKENLPAALAVNFNHAYAYITLATQEIRNLSHRLAPVFFKDASLEDAFEHLLANFNIEKKYAITLHFDDASKSYPLARELQLNLYRVLQEQLRNISKHAHAKGIEVAVTINNNRLQMKIGDDGIGFDVEEGKGGIGLANMKRRVQLFAGKFTVDSAVGSGCAVLVQIPLTNSFN